MRTAAQALLNISKIEGAESGSIASKPTLQLLCPRTKNLVRVCDMLSFQILVAYRGAYLSDARWVEG